VGCFEPMGKPVKPGVIDEKFEFGLLPEDRGHFEPMMENALHRLPVLETAEVKMLLNDPESFTPDGTFMLGETAETRGLFPGCGMNSVGIACGGGAGMNLAHCIVHGHTACDLTETDAKRFAPVFNNIDHLMARAPEIPGTHYEISYPGRQLKSARYLRALPLEDVYRKAGAEFGQFYGWERPLYFNGMADPELTFGRSDWFENVSNEVMSAHENAAIFDASPFGKIEVTGPDAEAFLQYTCASNMDRQPGSAIYTAVLNERGTYESDITAHRISKDHYRLFVGTNAIRRDIAWFRRHADGFQVTLVDSTEEYAVLGIMGPNAANIVAESGAPELQDLGYFKVDAAFISGMHVRAARMSYVGEAGFELTMKAENAGSIYQAFTNAGASPAGFYAQTSMRIEKGFAAMGHELDSDVTPLECGLDRMVSKKKAFIGSESLMARRGKAMRTLVTVILEDESAVPLGHEPIYNGSTIIGHTTSASFGYRIGKPIALAHVHAMNPGGLEIELDITGSRFRGRLQFTPAFDPEGNRMKSDL